MLINIVYIGFSIFRILDSLTRLVIVLSCGGFSLLEHATLQHKHKWKKNNWRENMTPTFVMSLPLWAEVLFISCLNNEIVCFQHNQVFMYWFGHTKSDVSLPVLFLFFIYPLHTLIQLQTSKYICPSPDKPNSIQMIKQPIWICVFGMLLELSTGFWSTRVQQPVVLCLPLKETQLHRNRYGKIKLIQNRNFWTGHLVGGCRWEGGLQLWSETTATRAHTNQREDFFSPFFGFVLLII